MFEILPVKLQPAFTFYIDEIPSKKPIQIEDMTVKDENGRRRFHGAFTGGFSAGFWNTVGSKDGNLEFTA